MTAKDLRWLWAASARICDGNGIVRFSRRFRFIARAMTLYDSILPLIHAEPRSPLGRLLAERPETIGAAVWPYQCLAWDARTRLSRIREHYAALERVGGLLDFPVDVQMRLLDLGEIRHDLSIVLDQPKWFLREGQLAINLFFRDTRLYSLVFSLLREADGVCTFVGAIQGRAIEGVLEDYRELTKLSHGMRPRDLLIESFRMLCAEIGVRRIYAVSDEYRHHRDPYFGVAASRKFSTNYDEIWSDRGGVRVDRMFYQLKVEGEERDLATVPAKKRGMYRRRFEMLGRLREELHRRCRGIEAPTLAQELPSCKT